MSPHREHGGLSSKKDKPLGGGLSSDSSNLSDCIDNHVNDITDSPIQTEDSLSSAFISIWPDSEVSSAFGIKGFSSLGSKTDPVLQIQYPMPWKILAERESFLEISENSELWYGILNRVITFFVPEYRENQ